MKLLPPEHDPLQDRKVVTCHRKSTREWFVFTWSDDSAVEVSNAIREAAGLSPDERVQLLFRVTMGVLFL